MSIGAWVVIGVGIGTAISAATGQAFWLAIGVGTGVGIGTAIGVAAQNGNKDATAGAPRQSGARPSSAAPPHLRSGQLRLSHSWRSRVSAD